MEDDIGNPIPIPRREGSYYGYVAAELTDINDNDRVSIMNYIFDETNWADFMSDFVGEIENNREVGFIKVPVRHHLADRIFSWVFRKLDVCLVGVEDGDGEVLYELGDRINRWLKDAQLTGYTGSYRDLLGEDQIDEGGNRFAPLTRPAFQSSAPPFVSYLILLEFIDPVGLNT
ncbi:hypothetical protein Tco_1268510 [Tanacetum coccineum]